MKVFSKVSFGNKLSEDFVLQAVHRRKLSEGFFNSFKFEGNVRRVYYINYVFYTTKNV